MFQKHPQRYTMRCVSMSSVKRSIFSQFVSIITSIPSCRKLNECDFEYEVVAGSRDVITVCYALTDSCGRCMPVRTVIDCTGICYEDLCDESWIAYLTQIAIALEKRLRPIKPLACPPKKRLVHCEQPRWKPLPCCLIQVVESKPVVCKPIQCTVTKYVTTACECNVTCPVCPEGQEEVCYEPEVKHRKHKNPKKHCSKPSQSCYSEEEHHQVSPYQMQERYQPMQRPTSCGC